MIREWSEEHKEYVHSLLELAKMLGYTNKQKKNIKKSLYAFYLF